jgi:hypothetical protein
MKRLLLAGVGLAALCGYALSQVNTVPQQGLITSVLKRNTYSAVSIGLVPAASATDIFCISGSSSKAISVKRIGITGTAGTLVTTHYTLLHRAVLDTGGTAATTTALPVAAPHMSTNPTATATLVAYTANPTINDASPIYLRSAWITLPTTAAGTVTRPINWNFSSYDDFFAQGADIPSGGTAQQYCINGNAVSVSSGLLDIDIEWTEN